MTLRTLEDTSQDKPPVLTEAEEIRKIYDLIQSHNKIGYIVPHNGLDSREITQERREPARKKIRDRMRSNDILMHVSEGTNRDLVLYVEGEKYIPVTI